MISSKMKDKTSWIFLKRSNILHTVQKDLVSLKGSNKDRTVVGYVGYSSSKEQLGGFKNIQQLIFIKKIQIPL